MQNWGQVAVFDLETTGIDVETARIVSACVAVLAADGSVIGRWDWLADPGVEIPDGAAAVHGITTERARAEGRPAHVVVAEITQTLRVLFALGIPLVVYNAPYDLTLLDRECRRHNLEPLETFSPVIDPLVIDKAVDRYRKGKRTLVATAELYKVALDDAHDAGSDAIAAGRVAQALGHAYPDELDISLADLHGRQAIWYAEQAASFQEYIRKAKGDVTYVADTAWPIRPAAAPSTLIDTQPIPAPAPRPSLTVPVLDLYGTGVIAPAASPDEQQLRGHRAPANLGALNVGELNIGQVNIGQLNVREVNVDRLDIGAGAELERPAMLDALAALEPVSASDAPEPHASRPSRPNVLRVAAGIITDGAGRTLLVRKRGTTAFMQAGGKIESGESALDALARELGEEIGLTIDLDTTEYLGSFRAVAANEPDTVIRAEVFALITNEPLTPRGEIEELFWLELGDRPAIELAPLTRDTILPLWAERRSALF